MYGDTIAAVATAPGRGGIAVVRVSGPDAFGVARALSGREASPGRALRANIKVDDCVMVAFKGPRSYTGEDVVEFQCHGGTVTPRRVLEACLSYGARLARRGEFTERAFLNGRMDYDQARSVLDLVDARTDRAADAALDGLAGRRAKERRNLYERALAFSTMLEHALDVDDGELDERFFASLRDSLAGLSGALKSAAARIRETRLLRNGALVVLAGAPNAGKSSLLNAMLDENRAIVDDAPGTTRDSIEAWIDLDGWPVRLVDTAGLRDTADAVEAEGVRRAEDLIARADVVVALDCTHDGAILVHAKCDLSHGEGLNVSAKTGEGLDDLKRAIVSRLEQRAAAPADADCADKGEAALAVYSDALSRLDFTRPAPGPSFDIVLAANAARHVAESLGALVGATYSSDLLEALFSRFCVGK